jgi:hypothetical protein
MARRIVLFLVITTLAAVGANMPQFRQTALAAGLDQKGKADAKEATRLFKQGQYEEAAQIFARLSVDYPDMEIFERNLGACFYYLGKPEPALSNLRRYLGRRKDIAPDDKAVVDRWIDEMEKLRAQNAAASLPPAPAPAGRYTTTGGTVYDTKTKLTWQQAVPSTTYTWTGAKAYCAGLNLGGTGWRLPTVKELQTIVDDSRTSPSIDTAAFPSTPADYFWSSSPLAGSSSGAWGVGFGYGYTSSFVVSDTSLVRCVR